jgi:TonB family protein
VKKETKAKNFIPKPEYKGGPKALTQFIHDQLKYPKEALDKKIEGTVVLKAEINYRGEVIGTKIISGIGYGCDEEASRVVSLLKFHIDKIRNLKVTFFKTFNIHYKLPASLENTVSYTYVTNNPPQEDKPKSAPQNTTYGYVIKYN